MTPAESEKEARTLTSLTKQLENMVDLERMLDKPSQGEGANEPLNTQQLRKNLTQRLAQFEHETAKTKGTK